MLRVALAKTDIDNSLFSQSANRPKVGEPSTNPFAAATMQMTQLNEVCGKQIWNFKLFKFILPVYIR